MPNFFTRLFKSFGSRRRKERLYQMARSGALRPSVKNADSGANTELKTQLLDLAQSGSERPRHDPEFDAAIRKIEPTWFK